MDKELAWDTESLMCIIALPLPNLLLPVTSLAVLHLENEGKDTVPRNPTNQITLGK